MCEVIDRFLDVKVVSFISYELFRFGRCLRLPWGLGEMFIPMMSTPLPLFTFSSESPDIITTQLQFLLMIIANTIS